jgi:hypothetical protein
MNKAICLVALTVLFAACTTDYYTYSGSQIYQGQGGASKRINSIDLWIVGTPRESITSLARITTIRLALTARILTSAGMDDSPKLDPKCEASGPKRGESLRRFLCRFAQDCFKDRHLNRFAEVAIETCLPASR